MRQIKQSLLILLTAGFGLVSCGKDDETKPTPEPTPEPTEVPVPVVTTEVPTGFSSKPVEDQKQDVENAGIQLVAELEQLSESESMKVMSSMSSLTPTGSSANALVVAISNNETPKGITTSLKASTGSIADEFNDETGIYTWNSEIQDWDVETSTDQIVYKFPSTEDGTTNNAELAITEVKTQYIANIEDDAPTSIKAHLKVDGTTLVSYTADVEYNSDGLPTGTTTLDIEGAFIVSATVTSSASKIAESFSFKHNGSNILSFGSEINGELTEAKLNEVDSKLNDTIEASFSPLGELVSTASLYYQILDIKLSTTVNAKNLADNFDINKEQDAIINIINENVSIVLAYENGEIIANSTIILEESTDEWGYTSNEPNIEFIFADQSRVAADVYFEQSMKEFEAQMEAFITDLENTYSL